MSDRFDDLVGPIEDPAERERLRRVHELLLRVDAPPEVPARLAEPPRAPVVRLVPRRRTLALAAAAALLAFGLGWLGGARSDDPAVERSLELVATSSAVGAAGTLDLYEQDEAGNWPMKLVLRGLPPSRDRSDSYELWLTKDGRLAESCGVFTVHEGTTEVTLSVPFPLRRFDAWVVTRRGDDEILLTT